MSEEKKKIETYRSNTTEEKRSLLLSAVRVYVHMDNCPTCSVEIFAEASFEKSLRRTGSSFFCINGHSLSYLKK